MTVADPNVSTLGRWRTSVRRFAIRRAAIAIASVTVGKSPSGTLATMMPRSLAAARSGPTGGWADADGGRGPAFSDAIVRDARSFDSRIIDAAFPQSTMLLVKVTSGGREIVEKLVTDPRFVTVPMIAAVSDDVDIHDRESYIWGVFTRFDCERDVIFTENRLIGISPVYKGAMGIDATWKQGYPKPLVMDDDVVRRVDEKWGRLWK